MRPSTCAGSSASSTRFAALYAALWQPAQYRSRNAGSRRPPAIAGAPGIDCGAPASVGTAAHAKRSPRRSSALMVYARSPVRLTRQASALEQRDGRRLGDRRVGGEEHALRPAHTACVLPCRGDRARAPCRASSSMMSSEPRLAAPCTRLQSHAFTALTSRPRSRQSCTASSQPRRRFAERLADHPVHAGSGHQRRRAVERRDLRVGALLRAAAASPARRRPARRG